MRTSLARPLRIAAIQAAPNFGSIGFTFCPGKCDPRTLGGDRYRDLDRDLDTIREWGAAGVVTLLEEKELLLLKVERLGQEVVRRNMLWFHLPIVDAWVPDQDFEMKWQFASEQLHLMLRENRNVLVHCRGGLGRAGTIVARMLVELGKEPISAIKSVREIRPGAIENDFQEAFILTLKSLSKASLV